jgi:hypothetical protein
MAIINKLKFYQALIGLFSVCVLLFQVSCKKDSTPAPAPPVVTDQSFTQNFNSVDSLLSQGWVLKNLSDTLPYDTANGGSGGPGQGWSIEPETSNGETPYEDSGLLYNSYLAATDFDGNISDWLISPKLYLQNGDKISFYTLSHGSVGYGSSGAFGDRLQLRLNVFNTSDSIGTTSTDVGNFTKPLLDINPLYKVSPPGDYPTTWTKYEATITGLNQPDSGRFALRYFVELHGGANGDEIAVDKLEFKSAGH